ncbi:MAG: tetratricopeptide repeat protein [Terracidiphilus sp.]
MPLPASPPNVFRFGLYEVDCAQEVLLRNGMRVRIQSQSFRVLVMLLKRRGEIVTRNEMKETLWPDGTHVDFDGSLNVILKRLRAAIDDDSDNPRFIETVPRRGYRFIAPVVATPIAAAITSLASAEALAALTEMQPVTKPPVGAPSRFRTPRWAMSSAAALLLVGAGYGAIYRYESQRTRIASISAHERTAPVSVRPSLAVLGFENNSGKQEDAWLSAAFSEMFATELSGDGQVRLAPGQDVENLRGTNPWPQSFSLDQQTTARIGSALNSDWLVLGSFTALGHTEPGSLRLDVCLQRAATGQIVSEFSQVGTERDIFDLVSKAGDRLREHLGVTRMEERDVANVLSAMPLSPDATRFYALGVMKLRQYDALGARDLLEQAVRVDPKFSLAHAMLARAWSQLGYGQKSRHEVKAALDLSTDLPQQLRMMVQAQYFASIGHLEQVASIDRALFELYPDNLDYGLNLASVEVESGHASEARDVLARLRKMPALIADDPRIDLAAAASDENKDQALALLRSGAAKAAAQGKRVLYAQARRDECMRLLYGDHPDQGPAACNEAYKVFLAVGNRAGAADSLRLLGDGEGAQGHSAEAIATYRRALAYTEDLGEHEKTGAILNNMAIVLTNEGKLDEAETMYRDARKHFEAAGNIANMVTALVNIADIAYLRGKLDSAEKLYRQSLELESKLDPSNPGYLLSRLADLELAQGRVKEAQLDATTAKDTLKATGGSQYYTAAMNELGYALKAEGRLADARSIFDEALAIRKKMGENGLVAEEQTEIAELLLDQRSPDQAEPLIRSALAEFEKESADPAASAAYVLLSRALLEEGKLEDAEQMVKRGYTLSISSPDPALRLPAAIQSARVEVAAAFARARDGKAAMPALQKLKVVAITAKRLGYFDLECEARLALGEASMAMNAPAGRTELSTLADEARGKGYMLVAQKAELLGKVSVEQVASRQ